MNQLLCHGTWLWHWILCDSQDDKTGHVSDWLEHCESWKVVVGGSETQSGFMWIHFLICMTLMFRICNSLNLICALDTSESPPAVRSRSDITSQQMVLVCLLLVNTQADRLSADGPHSRLKFEFQERSCGMFEPIVVTIFLLVPVLISLGFLCLCLPFCFLFGGMVENGLLVG